MVDDTQNITPQPPKGQEEAAPVTPKDAPEGYRRLEAGEVIRAGDYVWPVHKLGEIQRPPLRETVAVDATIEDSDVGYYFRPIEAPAPMWMADSRPLLAEIAELKKERDSLRDSHDALVLALEGMISLVETLIPACIDRVDTRLDPRLPIARAALAVVEGR